MRLARAICSDISLYNEEKIVKSIEQDTFFDALKDELAEGREHYRSRVAARPVRPDQLLRPGHRGRDPEVEGPRPVARSGRPTACPSGASCSSPPSLAGLRLDLALVQLCARPVAAPGPSGSSRTGTCTVDGRAGHGPRPGCAAASGWRWSCRRRPPSGLIAQDLPLSVLHEDARPAGARQGGRHGGPPGPRHRPPARSSTRSCTGSAARARPGGERLGLVHRLDKDTSGCLVVAKREAALHGAPGRLQGPQGREDLPGALPRRARPTQGRLDTPYGRHPRDRTRYTGRVASRRGGR